ncbi:MAG: hypothetical protein EKK31_30390 [Hyphomicrobiales bacterium]|nr:MAG: hypothetical protein EKK31_30390 [Hyphomicrobiales bacterium]
MSPKATDEGCSRERQRLTPLEHPSSVSALRADPPSPTRGEGRISASPPHAARTFSPRRPNPARARRARRSPDARWSC